MIATPASAPAPTPATSKVLRWHTPKSLNTLGTSQRQKFCCRCDVALLSVRKCILLSVGIFFSLFTFLLCVCVCVHGLQKRQCKKKWSECRRKELIQSFSLFFIEETAKNFEMRFLLQCNRVSRQCARVLINKVKRVKWLLAIFQDVVVAVCWHCCCCTFIAHSMRTTEGKRMRVHVRVSTLAAKSKKILQPIFEMELVKWRREPERKWRKREGEMQKRVSLPSIVIYSIFGRCLGLKCHKL